MSSHTEMLVRLGITVEHVRPVKPAIQVGDVIQLRPDHAWALSTWIVSEVKGLSVTAYANVPSLGTCFLHLTMDQFEVVGPAAFVLQ